MGKDLYENRASEADRGFMDFINDDDLWPDNKDMSMSKTLFSFLFAFVVLFGACFLWDYIILKIIAGAYFCGAVLICIRAALKKGGNCRE